MRPKEKTTSSVNQPAHTTVPCKNSTNIYHNMRTLSPITIIPLTIKRWKHPAWKQYAKIVTPAKRIRSQNLGTHFACSKNVASSKRGSFHQICCEDNQCNDCIQAEQMVLSGFVTLNEYSDYCYYSSEKQCFYCLTDSSPSFCKPENNCVCCKNLDFLKLHGYIQIDEKTGVICRYSFFSHHFYCSRAMFQKTILNSEWCGPVEGPQCTLCAEIESKINQGNNSNIRKLQEVFSKIISKQSNWMQQNWNSFSNRELELKDEIYAHMLMQCDAQQIECSDILFEHIFELWYAHYSLHMCFKFPVNDNTYPSSTQTVASVVHQSLNSKSAQQVSKNSVVQKAVVDPLEDFLGPVSKSNITSSTTNADLIEFDLPNPSQPLKSISPTAPPKEEAEEDECSICMERECNAALVPCGHLKFCFECGTQLVYQKRDCPYCRQPVTLCIRIYK